MDIEALSDAELGLAMTARDASVVLSDETKQHAESLATKGWGTIKLSKNFGFLFRLNEGASHAVREWFYADRW